jgi:DMSO/TMAO reductase YedYZ heme-binding membrane subunit
MTLSWFLIRGAGIAAFTLVSLSLIWGLMMSSKVFGRAVKAKGLQWLHESLGLAGLLATVVHVVALVSDDFIDFSWSDVLVPGVSTWEPVAVSLGVVSFWMLAVVSLSFYVKRWIGQQRWRTIHFMSFGVFAGAAVHGVMAGTDSSNPFVVALYVGCTSAVLVLTAIRLIAANAPESASPRAGTRTPSSAAARPAADPVASSEAEASSTGA